MKTTNAILSVLTVLALDTAAAQTMYKCVQDGKVSFQAEPCPAAAKQDALKSRAVAPASAASGAASAAVPVSGAAPDAEVNRMIEFMSSYRACADGIQVWGQEMAAPYGAWRSRNAAMVSRIESDKQLQARYQQRVDAKRNGPARMCRDAAIELRGKD